MLPTLVDQPTLLYARAEQLTINGNHFVRIPTNGKGSDKGSFYFKRRPDGSMEVNYVVQLVSDSIKGNGIVGFANLDEKSFRVNVYENNKLVLSKIVPDSLGLFNQAFLSSATQIKKLSGCPEEATRITLPDGSDSVILVKKMGDPRTDCPRFGDTWWQKVINFFDKIGTWLDNLFGGGGGGGNSGGGDSWGFGFQFYNWGYTNGGVSGIGNGYSGSGGSGGAGGSQNGPSNPWGPFTIPGGMFGSYQLTDRDREILEEIQREDDEADAAYLNNPCGSTLRYGNLAWKGPLEHVMIQIDYIYQNKMYGEREYKIPFSGSGGQKPGYADIVNTLTNEIFEIKPDDPTRIAEGRAEVQNYVTKANLFCPILNASISPIWRKGFGYQPRYINFPKNPTLSIVTKLQEPGVIVYDYVSRNPATQPIVIPQDIADKLKRFLQEAAKNLNGLTPEKIVEFLQKNPEVVDYIKFAAVGAGVSIIVGTIVEDFLTAGVGVADDVQCFLLGYKLIRIAWKL